MVDSVEQFQQKKKSALAVDWNNSCPIRETRALALVIQKLEKELRLRLKNQNGS
jgi:hypothetical protein